MGGVGPVGPPGPTGPSLNALCGKIGGLVYKDMCFKRSKLRGNSDSLPPDCNVFNPRASWGRGDVVALMRMFRDRPGWEKVRRPARPPARRPARRPDAAHAVAGGEDSFDGTDWRARTRVGRL